MLIYWFLPMILFIGIVTSYEDIKYGKIRNKWIILGLIYLIIVNFILYLFYNVYKLDLFYFNFLLINGALALIAGFLIWYIGLWTAGDAKLFFVYVLLIPPLAFGNLTLTFSDLLINTFVPIALFLIIFALIKTRTKDLAFYFKETFRLKRLLQAILFLFVLIWPINFISTIFPIENIIILVILALIFFTQIFEKVFSNKILYLILILALLRIIFDKTIFLLDTWIFFLFLIIIFVIIRLFLVGLSYGAFTKQVLFKNLKAGMMPSEIIYKKGRKYGKKPLRLMALNEENKNYLFQPTNKGLTTIDIKKIIKIKSIKTLRIQETLSFAPFLFLGVLLQILLNGNILNYFRNLIGF